MTEGLQRFNLLSLLSYIRLSSEYKRKYKSIMLISRFITLENFNCEYVQCRQNYT